MRSVSHHGAEGEIIIMTASEQIQDEALHFIQSIDAAAYEAYAIGDITPDRYRRMAEKIAEYQRQTENMLYTLGDIVPTSIKRDEWRTGAVREGLRELHAV